MNKVTIKDVRNACDAYNRKRGLYRSDMIGHIRFADIKGDGVKRKPSVWATVNAQGGVTRSDLNGKTYRETLRNIEATK